MSEESAGRSQESAGPGVPLPDDSVEAFRVPWWVGAVSGAVAVGVTLAVGEVFDGVSRAIPSLVVAVGDFLIDSADARTTEAAIELFGQNDKPALLIGIVAVSLILGAGIGAVGLKRRWVPLAMFAALGIAGGLAVGRDPQGSDGLGWLAASVAALIGWLTYEVLLYRSSLRASVRTPAGTTTTDPPGAGDPVPVAAGAPRFGRGQFIRWAAGAGAAAVIGGVVGRWLRRKASVSADRLEVAGQLPVSALEPAEPRVAVSLPGVSSYITPNRDFYRIDTALSVPQVDPARWRLQIGGMVDRPYELSLAEILAGDLEERTVTLSCVSNRVGGDLVGNAVWTGIPLLPVLERVGIQAGADQIAGYSVDGWSAGFPTSVVDGERTAMIAVGMNGEPLPIAHGFPARLIVAGLYGYVSAVKWLSAIELTTWDAFDGYWIPRGWSKEGPMKISSRIDTPRDRSSHPPGPIGIGGVAWAPTRGIGAVEVQPNDGEWVGAELAEAVSDETWVQWVLRLELEPGVHSLRVRAYDLAGERQPAGPKGPAPDGAEGYHSVVVNVDHP